MATIRITNLRLKTIIGINDWERTTKQTVVINIALEFNASRPAKSDNIKDTIDYKTLTKKVIKRERAESQRPCALCGGKSEIQSRLPC